MAVSGIVQTMPVMLSSIVLAGEAASSTSDEGTSLESALTMVYIKNTFVEVIDSVLFRRAVRRTASAPPSFRFEELAGDSQSASVRSQPKLPPSSNSWSTASTSSTHAAGDEQCDSLGETDPSDRSDTVSLKSSQEGTPIALADLLPPVVRPMRAALNSRAKAYSPGFAVPAAGRMPAEVRQQFADVVAAGQASLRASTVIENLGMSEGTGGWSVLGFVRQMYTQQVQSAIALAQDAMLHAAEESSNVYIIGYEVAPFALSRSGFGFTAQIAIVQDESNACWDLLARGYCCRGSSCRWTHPNWEASVDVSIQLSHLE